mgnify:CR=1 FL=1
MTDIDLVCLMSEPLFNNITPSFITNNIHELGKWMKRYEKFPPETRFLMLIDKIQMLIMAGKLAAGADSENQIERYQNDEKLTPQEKGQKIEKVIKNVEALNTSIELIQNEFNALEDFIQSDTKSILKRMEGKLDAFLDGPDYEPGQKIMQEAKTEFEKKLKL